MPDTQRTLEIEPARKVAPVESSAQTPMAMLDKALSSGATPEILEKLLALQERWEANQGRKSFDDAIASAKAEIPTIIKNATGHNNKKYANFAAIAEAVDPVLGKYGLSYRFRTHQQDGEIRVTCVLSHRDGHSEETTLSGPSDTSGNKNAIQAVGSTLTYLQRYSLVQALGLAASEDDDGRLSGDSDPLTEEQVESIRKGIDATNSDTERLCKWLGIDAITEMNEAQYKQAKAMLERKGWKP